jgi:hypothetical protein
MTVSLSLKPLSQYVFLDLFVDVGEPTFQPVVVKGQSQMIRMTFG